LHYFYLLGHEDIALQRLNDSLKFARRSLQQRCKQHYDRHIPWSLFKQPFLDHTASPPWKVWRGNFYRYDYPYRTVGPPEPGFNHSHFELTAWSPTHSGSFHTPPRFGVIELV